MYELRYLTTLNTNTHTDILCKGEEKGEREGTCQYVFGKDLLGSVSTNHSEYFAGNSWTESYHNMPQF